MAPEGAEGETEAVDMSEYEKILRPVGAVGYADCSMIDYATAIKTCIETEMEKIDPDNALMALLINAGRIGWELIEKSQVK